MNTIINPEPQSRKLASKKKKKKKGQAAVEVEIIMSCR